MIDRKHPGAIVITASGAAITAIPGMTTYCATKTFADFIGQGLYYELREHQIDVLSWQLG